MGKFRGYSKMYCTERDVSVQYDTKADYYCCHIIIVSSRVYSTSIIIESVNCSVQYRMIQYYFHDICRTILYGTAHHDS